MLQFNHLFLSTSHFVFLYSIKLGTALHKIFKGLFVANNGSIFRIERHVSP